MRKLATTLLATFGFLGTAIGVYANSLIADGRITAKNGEALEIIVGYGTPVEEQAGPINGRISILGKDVLVEFSNFRNIVDGTNHVFADTRFSKFDLIYRDSRLVDLDIEATFNGDANKAGLVSLSGNMEQLNWAVWEDHGDGPVLEQKWSQMGVSTWPREPKNEVCASRIFQSEAKDMPQSTETGCFWMENRKTVGDQRNYCWVDAPQAALTKARCQALDGCSSEGGNESGGGCYKWSDGYAAPRQAWSTQ